MQAINSCTAHHHPTLNSDFLCRVCFQLVFLSSHALCVRLQTMCEPLRSLEEGLCPFKPSEEAQRHAAAITDLDEELAQVRLRLDRYGLAPVFFCLCIWFRGHLSAGQYFFLIFEPICLPVPYSATGTQYLVHHRLTAYVRVNDVLLCTSAAYRYLPLTSVTADCAGA